MRRFDAELNASTPVWPDGQPGPQTLGYWLTQALGLGLSDGNKGDITVASTGAAWTVNANAVTNAKLADMAALTIKGSLVGGDPIDLTPYQARTITETIPVLPSIAALRAMTTTTYPGDTVRVTSWLADKNKGGGLFHHVPAPAPSMPATDDSITTIYDVSGRHWQLQRQTDLSPTLAGATGDGSTADNTAYAAAEAAATSIHLLGGQTYNLTGGTFPTKLVKGPGKVGINGVPLGSFDVLFDVKRTNIICTPDNYAKIVNGPTQTPGGETNYFNTVIASGSNAGDTSLAVWRNVLIGNGAGEAITSFERVTGVGEGSFRFAKYAERCNAFGSINMQWLGQTITAGAHSDYWYHDFFTEAVLPGVAGWDFHGLETYNPGVGTAIAAFSSWASDTSTVARNDAFGRDALLHIVKGVNNGAFGYRALADLYEGSDNVAFGKDCLFRGVWLDETTAMGVRCAEQVQDGSGSVLMGARLGLDLVTSTSDVLLGTLSAGTYWSTARCIFIGPSSGQAIYEQTITGATQANPGVITVTAHGYSNGTKVYIRNVGGMTELNGLHYLTANVTANTFTLQTLAGVDVDTTAYTAYTTGGTVNKGVVADILAIQNASTRAPLIGGDFANAKLVLGLGNPGYAQGTVTIVTANVSAGSANAVADELVLVNNGNAGMTILTGNTNLGGIYFADDTQNQAGGITYGHSADRFTFRTANTDRVYISGAGNLKIAGAAVRATTEGTNHLDIFDGTAPVGTLANGISLYSTAGELRVMDAAGNATLLSPHDRATNEWVYDSVDTRDGRHLRIDMERMMKALNEKFGWNYIHETGAIQ